jgi:hypothetical protein
MVMAGANGLVVFFFWGEERVLLDLGWVEGGEAFIEHVL